MESPSSNSAPARMSQTSVPVFDAEGYEHLSIMMRTLFRSHDLWDLVDQGFSEDDDEAIVKDNKRRDSHTLFLIQQALHKPLFSCIVVASTAKEAWDKLHRECQGTSRVMAVKLQMLRQSFETLHIKSKEGVQNYVSRVVDLANQMGCLSDTLSESMVVGKVMSSLGPKFKHVVVVIEESKDLTKLTLDEWSGSLQAH